MRLILLLMFAFTCLTVKAADGPYVHGYANNYTTLDAAIANSGTTSTALDLKGFTLVGIYFPAAFTGTTVTFTMSNTIGGTYQPLYNSSGQVSYTIAQGRYYAIDPKDFQGIRFIKIVSGSTEGGARTLTLSLKGLN